ncbi:MAG: FkbM family methyltransferase [Planctomycetia bacterium]|nr:FkbM family methyltransferase [Planctomycetia bacterium]
MGAQSLPSGARSLLWRLGRRVYAYARGERSNDPVTNGEYWLLERLLAGSSGRRVLLDVGANVGDWTAKACQLGGSPEGLIIHSFEPCAGTRQRLAARFEGRKEVLIHGSAVSDTAGERTFYSREDGAGTNSLDPLSGPRSESVKVTTLDGFFQEQALERAVMVKIDTEGFDLMVLRGASRLLQEGRIEVLQFEYNWRWLVNHACLRDVFALVEGRPYSLGKLVGSGIEFYGEWHFELDRFFEGNYVLVRDGSTLKLLGTEMKFGPSNTAVAT